MDILKSILWDLHGQKKFCIFTCDWNVGQDPSVDLFNYVNPKKVRPISREVIIVVIAENLLDDHFRLTLDIYTTKTNRTFKSKSSPAQSRLDYFLVDEQLMKFVRSTTITGEESNFRKSPLSLQIPEWSIYTSTLVPPLLVQDTTSSRTASKSFLSPSKSNISSSITMQIK